MQRLPQYDTFAIDREQIWADPDFNCRHSFPAHSVKELSKSIEQDGLKIPLMVQPGDECNAPAEYSFRLVAGFRRYYAIVNFLKWDTIPCQIHTGLSDENARKLNYIENLERKDLNLLEEAEGLYRLYRNASSNEIARKIQRPVNWVNDRMLLMAMPDSIKAKAAAGTLTAYNIRQINQESPERWGLIAEQIESSKKPSRGTKRGRYEKNTLALSKKGISELITQMYIAGIEEGIGPAVACRCAGYITDEDMRDAINLEKARQTAFALRESGIAPIRESCFPSTSRC